MSTYNPEIKERFIAPTGYCFLVDEEEIAHLVPLETKIAEKFDVRCGKMIRAIGVYHNSTVSTICEHCYYTGWNEVDVQKKP